MIVLDTDVVSELMRKTPNSSLVSWMRQNSVKGLFTTTVTIAEIRYGIARLPEGRRREELQQAANEIFAAFPRQVLTFDLAAANIYAEVVTVRESCGKPISGFDAQIAAICRAQEATLATRNTKDFLGTGIKLENPWEPEAGGSVTRKQRL